MATIADLMYAGVDETDPEKRRLLEEELARAMAQFQSGSVPVNTPQEGVVPPYDDGSGMPSMPDMGPGPDYRDARDLGAIPARQTLAALSPSAIQPAVLSDAQQVPSRSTGNIIKRPAGQGERTIADYYGQDVYDKYMAGLAKNAGQYMDATGNIISPNAQPKKTTGSITGQYKEMLDKANADLLKQEQMMQANPLYFNDTEKADFAKRRANLNSQMGQLAQLEQFDEARADRGLLKNDPRVQDAITMNQLAESSIRQKGPQTPEEKAREEALVAAAKAAQPGTVENERLQTLDQLSQKGEAAWQSSLNDAKKLKGFLDQAIKDTDWTSAGLIGQALSAVGGTSAADLESTLDTIKAKIGFNELQQMRKESPTGGALGQVAVRELEFLQAVEGSLKQKQTPAQLKKNLGLILESTARLEEDLRKNPPDWTGQKVRTPNQMQPAARPTGAPVPVTSEAEANRLPKGTLIIINGRRAIVE